MLSQYIEIQIQIPYSHLNTMYLFFFLFLWPNISHFPYSTCSIMRTFFLFCHTRFEPKAFGLVWLFEILSSNSSPTSHIYKDFSPPQISAQISSFKIFPNYDHAFLPKPLSHHLLYLLQNGYHYLKFSYQ